MERDGGDDAHIVGFPLVGDVGPVREPVVDGCFSFGVPVRDSPRSADEMIGEVVVFDAGFEVQVWLVLVVVGGSVDGLEAIPGSSEMRGE